MTKKITLLSAITFLIASIPIVRPTPVIAGVAHTKQHEVAGKQLMTLSGISLKNGYGYCLGVGPTVPGTTAKKVVNGPCSGSNTWSTVSSPSTGGFLLMNDQLGSDPLASSAVCLLATNPTKDGLDLVMNRCNLSNKTWTGLPSGGVALVNTSFCLDVEVGTPSIGSPIQIWTCQPITRGARIPAQQWSYPSAAFATSPVTTVPTGVPLRGNLSPTTVPTGVPLRGNQSTTLPPTIGEYIPPLSPGQMSPNPWVEDKKLCADLMFVGFRGSSEQPIGFTEDGIYKGNAVTWGTSDFIKPPVTKPLNKKTNVQEQGADLDHLGPNLGMLYRAVARRYPKLRVGFYSVGVDEPGMPFKNIKDGIYPAIHVSPWPTEDGFWNSLLRAGRDSNIEYLNQVRTYVTKCPNSQLGIAGYSQGAIAARRLSIDLKKSPMRSRVMFTALVADPLFSKDEFKYMANPESVDGDALLRDGISQICPKPPLKILNYVPDQECGLIKTLANFYKRSFKESLSVLYASRLNELSGKKGQICMAGDLVCSPVKRPLITKVPLFGTSGYLLASVKIHSSYWKRPQDWWNYVVDNLR